MASRPGQKALSQKLNEVEAGFVRRLMRDDWRGLGHVPRTDKDHLKEIV
jgi:hypothetical protein